MTNLVPTDQIESIVGAQRHPTDHIARYVTAEQTVYILHSHACKDWTLDLRNCPYSIALDRGQGEDAAPHWQAQADRPVRVQIIDGWLKPGPADPKTQPGCVFCDGPHALAACPTWDPDASTDAFRDRCDSCGGRIDRDTLNCRCFD
jgi:hypothetical protein